MDAEWHTKKIVICIFYFIIFWKWQSSVHFFRFDFCDVFPIFSSHFSHVAHVSLRISSITELNQSVYCTLYCTLHAHMHSQKWIKRKHTKQIWPISLDFVFAWYITIFGYNNSIYIKLHVLEYSYHNPFHHSTQLVIVYVY